MEQHPVPQNVTNFQFRLVGDMTLKQFGYLASGIILGYICYKLPLPFFFTWPLGLTALLGGIGLAFVPVQERPMDIWITSFLKNTYNPTQYVWQKTKEPQKETAAPPSVPQQKKSFFSGMFPNKKPQSPTTPKPEPKQESKESVTVGDMVGRFFKPKTQPQAAIPTPVSQPKPVASPHPQEITTNDQKIENLEKVITSMQQQLASKTENEKRMDDLKVQLAQALSQKEQTDKELIALRQQLGRVQTAPTPVTRPAGFVQVNPTKGPTVRVIAPEGAVRAGLPRLTTFPNVVSGIVKDQYGNLLPGVLVTVRDKDDVPLRALKTNKLGQFAASTPLPNGTYLIEIEDPRGAFTFDRAQATLIGAVLPPIEVVAKSQKQINRDKLAKELFGDQKIQ